MSDLPTNLPEWKPWGDKVLKRIRESRAMCDLDKLTSMGCDREALLFRLAAVLALQGRQITWKASGLTRHKIKNGPKKLREAARLVECYERVWSASDSGEISPHSTKLISSLNSFADGMAEMLPPLLRPPRVTLEIAALCSLVAYVERMTKRNCDAEVSALIAAVLGKDNYVATHLAQWRSKHKREIADMAHCIVNPLIVRSISHS